MKHACRQHWKLENPVSEAKCHSAGDQQCLASERSQGSWLTCAQSMLKAGGCCFSQNATASIGVVCRFNLVTVCQAHAIWQRSPEAALTDPYPEAISGTNGSVGKLAKTVDLIAHTCGCLCRCEVKQNWTRRNHSVNCCSGWDEFSCKTFELISGEGR